jgi:hypothetical protein
MIPEKPPIHQAPSKGLHFILSVGSLGRPLHPHFGAYLRRHAGRDSHDLARPWPLKIILDNIVGNHKLPALAEQCVT